LTFDARTRVLRDHANAAHSLTRAAPLPSRAQGTHLIHADPKSVQEHLAKIPSQIGIDVDPACLHWQPLQAAPARKRP